MRNLLVLASCVAAACASSPRPRPIAPPAPQGYAAHMEAAAQHSDAAAQHRQQARRPDTGRTAGLSYQCGDTVMSDQVTSGGERLVQSRPCWDPSEANADRHEAVAEREQRLADQERRLATSMVQAELVACRGLSRRDLERSPFSHRRAISEVVPHRETGTLRGVRVIFKPVPGLTATWMRQAIACHRARFERLGEPAGYLPEDPSLVANATTTVDLRGNHIVVAIESSDDISATVALERAQDLVRTRSRSALR